MRYSTGSTKHWDSGGFPPTALVRVALRCLNLTLRVTVGCRFSALGQMPFGAYRAAVAGGPNGSVGATAPASAQMEPFWLVAKARDPDEDAPGDCGTDDA